MVDDNTTVEQDKLHGIFIGTVLQHLAHGKLKVYIHGIHPSEYANKPSLLPTCLQMVPQFGGSHDGNGVFSYPNVGATVLCTFANGDQNLPIMLGVIQGGENAFGQYEWIKLPSETSSTKHLVTSGKSHVELYENGKISAIVVDPIRTEAKVEYDDSIDGQLSIDAVDSRPLCEKVESEEISNINCQFVLDNDDRNGTISSSTHWYNPSNEKNILSANNGQIIIISSLNGEQRNDYHYVVGNDGMVDDGQSYSAKNVFTMNRTNASTNSMEQLVQPLTSKVDVKHHYGIDGSEYIDIVSNYVNSINYAQKNASGNIISTMNMNAEYSNCINQNVPLDFEMNAEQKYKLVQTYVDSSINDMKSKTLKSTASNSFYASKDLQIALETLSSSRLNETDTILQLMPHTNKHNATSYLTIQAEKGIDLESMYDDKDFKQIGSMTTEIKKKNTASIESQVNPNIYLKLYAHYKNENNINGAIDKKDVECKNFMLPVNQKIEISIVDNVNNSSCSIVLGADGVAKVNASQRIELSAPLMTMTGETLVQQFKTMTLKAQTMNISGANGDCKIKNVSLLNHKHQETQSGDVVKPQPTKTAKTSN